MTDAIGAPAPKLDPEMLAIRSSPLRAIRFRRGVIIAIAAIGSVSLIAVTWMALNPRLLHHVDVQEELSQPNARPTGNSMNKAPATYSDVPRLGQPLPGDLGKPILERQQATLAAVGPADRQVQQAEEAERVRRLAELKAARESGVLVQSRQGGGTAETPPASTTVPNAAPAETSKLALDANNDPNTQGRKAEFVAGLDPKGDMNPHVLTPLPSPYTLSAGSVISASLITGLRSDLPGLSSRRSPRTPTTV